MQWEISAVHQGIGHQRAGIQSGIRKFTTSFSTLILQSPTGAAFKKPPVHTDRCMWLNP